MKKLSFAILLSLYGVQSQAAEVRAMGMGGVSSVGGNYLSAPTNNPALLASQADEDDDFGFVLPYVSAAAEDEGDLFNAIDEFQLAFDELEAKAESATTIEEVEAARDNLVDKFAGLETELKGNIEFGFAIAAHTGIGSLALFGDSQLDMIANTDVADSDITRLNEASTPDELEAVLDDLNSGAGIIAANVIETGLTYANTFNLSENALSVGLTLKAQRIDMFNYNTTVSEFDEDNFDQDEYLADDSGFNIDLGLVYALTDSVSFGLSARNLISADYETKPLEDGSTTIYTVGPEITLGASYELKYLTLAADYQIKGEERFATKSDDSQYVSVGIEGDMLNWAQLRLGYKTDLEDNFDDLYTAGIGLSPFDVLHIDIAAQYAGERKGAVGVQLAFTF